MNWQKLNKWKICIVRNQIKILTYKNFKSKFLISLEKKKVNYKNIHNQIHL